MAVVGPRTSDPSDEPAWPNNPSQERIVFLAEAASRLERRMIEDWIEAARPDDVPPEQVEFVPIPSSRRPGRRALDARLEATLATSGDPLMAPLRVVWRAPLRDGERRVRLPELMLAGDPRDPNFIRQWWVARRSPERCRVISGEPAYASDLRRRWTESCGPNSGETLGLATFVAQKATLALERRERSLRGARYKVPKLVHEEILGRPAFRGGLARISQERLSAGDDNRSRSGLVEIAQEAAKDLDEIAATHSTLVIDLLSTYIRWLYSRGYSETLIYDQKALEGIAALEARHPVVFLPSHKSNLDHLVLQYALYENGLPPNHTAGGINMNFFPFGALVRRTGVFFIRRSFRDDAVYKHVLSHYIDYLVEKRFPLEWYIEGGRSRSGKLLPPRFGLLANVADAYRRGKSDDVYLVPVSIAYDQIQDLGSYVREQKGGAKEKESLSWLIRMVRQLKRRYGKIHIEFGEPVSLASHLGPGEASHERSPEQQTLELQKLAFEISVRINRATPITPTSLVTLALLGTSGRALSVEETRRSLENLLQSVRLRNLPTTADLHHLETDEGIEYTLDALVENDVLTRFDGGRETVFKIGDGQQLSAAYYRNTVVHFFVAGAIAELALLHSADGERRDALPRFWEEVMRLRDLLKFEFFFPEKDEFREEIRAELELTTRGWEKKIEEFEIDPDELIRRTRPYCAHRVLRPFLESYRVVADQLSTIGPGVPFDEKRFLTDCLGLGRQYELQHRIHAADSISKVLFQTALRLARHRGLLEQGAEEISTARHAFAEELRDAVRRVDIIVALAASRRAGFRG